MALSVKNDEADRLARELARLTGESITETIVVALRQRLAREQGRRGVVPRLHALMADLSSLPVRDPRTHDQILGYDEFGLPG